MDNLWTIPQEGNMETRRITPFFSSTFSALTVCNIHFVFETSQNSFSCGPPLVHSGQQNTSILDKSYRFGQPIILF